MHTTKNRQQACLRSALVVTLILLLASSSSFVTASVTAPQSMTILTGNWVVRTPNADGTFRLTYLNLKQEESRITGSIRVTQFYYQITEGTVSGDTFILEAAMKDGQSLRRVRYEGKLVGDELHVSTRRRPEDAPTEMV